MRLWHRDLIIYLPRPQLLAQWRELNLIFKREPRHILINYIYTDEYKDKVDLFLYAQQVIDEMKRRHYKVNMANFNLYFQNITPRGNIKPFEKYHNDEYLWICYYNLKEKFMRGQKNFSLIEFNDLTEYITHYRQEKG